MSLTPRIDALEVYEELKVTRTTAYAFTSGGPSTWRLPDSAFNLVVAPGTWRFKIIGQSVSNSTGAWSGSVDCALSNSTTPGSGLLTDRTSILSVQNSADARGPGHVVFENIAFLTTTTVYIHIIASNALGVPTFSANGFGYIGNSTFPIRFVAERVVV